MIKVFGTIEDALKAADRRAYLLGEEGPLRLKKYGGAGHPVEFTTIVKVDKPGGAPEIKEDLLLQKVTYPGKELVEKAISVFRAAYKRYYTEMAVILRWFPPTDDKPGRYAIDRPEFALLSGAHVRHVYRQQRMGVIHSHPTFSGSPSGIDDSNEMDTPGVYMVIGDISSSKPSITFSICGDGFRLTDDYPFKEFDPKPLTEEEEAWWFENVMKDSDANAKTDGFVMKDKDDKLLYWFATEEEAKAAAGEDYKVEAARKAYTYSPAPSYRFAGCGDYDDWDGMYEAYHRRVEWEAKTADTPPVTTTEDKHSGHTHLFYSRGKRRKKNRGPLIHFSFKQGEWVEVGLRLRNIIGCESLDVKKEFLNALLYGESKPAAQTTSVSPTANVAPPAGDPKVVVVHGFHPVSHFGSRNGFNSTFVQPQKPGRLIIIPPSGAPVDISRIGEMVVEPEKAEPAPEPEPTPEPDPTPSDKDETAVFQIDDVKIKLAEMNLEQAEDKWRELKQRYNVPDNASGEEVLDYAEAGHISSDEANEILEAEGDVYQARQSLTVAHIVQKRLAQQAAEVASAVAKQLDGEIEEEAQPEQEELDLPDLKEEIPTTDLPKREPEFISDVTGHAGEASIKAMEKIEEERRKYEEGMYYDGFCGG